jgi:hypothetical protein
LPSATPPSLPPSLLTASSQPNRPSIHAFHVIESSMPSHPPSLPPSLPPPPSFPTASSQSNRPSHPRFSRYRETPQPTRPACLNGLALNDKSTQPCARLCRVKGRKGGREGGVSLCFSHHPENQPQARPACLNGPFLKETTLFPALVGKEGGREGCVRRRRCDVLP